MTSLLEKFLNPSGLRLHANLFYLVQKNVLRPVTHYVYFYMGFRVFSGFGGHFLLLTLVAQFFYNQGKQYKSDPKT